MDALFLFHLPPATEISNNFSKRQCLSFSHVVLFKKIPSLLHCHLTPS